MRKNGEMSGVAEIASPLHPTPVDGKPCILLVEDDAEISVVGEASTGKEAVRLALELRPKVIVMGSPVFPLAESAAPSGPGSRFSSYRACMSSH